MRFYLNKQWKVILIITTIAVILAALFIFLKPSTKSTENLNKGYFVSTEILKSGRYQPIVPVTVTASHAKIPQYQPLYRLGLKKCILRLGKKLKKVNY